MTHQEIQELLPLHVLGGLDDESMLTVERHLADLCDVCTAELREWQEVVGLIPLGFIPDGPSSAVKKRLLAQVRQDRIAPVVPFRPRRWRSAWITLPLAAAVALFLVIGGLRYQEAMQTAAEQTTRTETLAMLLAQEQEKLAGREAEIQQLNTQMREQQLLIEEKTQALAQLETSLTEQRQLALLREQEFARRQGEITQGRRTTATYEREVAELRAEVTRQREIVVGKEREIQEIRAVLAQQRLLVEASVREAEQVRDALARQRGVIEVLTAPGLNIGYLRRAKRGVEAQGHVLWNERRKTWLFYAFGLPQPPAGKEYQVWFMTEREGPVSAGLFVPDQTGTGSVLAGPPSRLFGKITATAVTLEPAGGLPKPSGEMYLRGSL
jgi:hypothetical protein